MKKLLLLVSFCAVVLVLSKMSFAQEAIVDPTAPCPCANCATGMPHATPFAYPQQRQFGSRLTALIGRRPAAPQMLPHDAPMMPVADVAAPGPLPYPYGVSDLRPRAVRRVARLTPQPPQPVPTPYPVAVMPPVAPPVEVAPGAYAPGPIAQTGLRNTSIQRSGSVVPVINFLSIIRTPYQHGGFYPLPPAQY